MRGRNGRVRSEGTRPERRVRQALLQMGLHYRVNLKGVPGSPDIAFPRVKKAIFVHGCFWHVHPQCVSRNLRGIHGKNSGYWREKLARNVLRDARDLRELEKLGWQVLVIWECECGNLAVVRQMIRKFLREGAAAA